MIKSHLRILYLLVLTALCSAQDLDLSESRVSPNGKFEVISNEDTQGNVSLSILDTTVKNTIFTENENEVFWKLASIHWRSDNKFVAITENIAKCNDNVYVFHVDSNRAIPINIPIKSEGSSFINWLGNGDLELLLSNGISRKNFPGDIISSYKAVIRFQGNPIRAKIISQTKPEGYTVE